MNPNTCEGGMMVQQWRKGGTGRSTRRIFLLLVLLAKASIVRAFTLAIPYPARNFMKPKAIRLRQPSCCQAADENNSNLDELSETHTQHTTLPLVTRKEQSDNTENSEQEDENVMEEFPSVRPFELTTQGIKEMFLELQTDVPLEQASISKEQLNIGFRKLLFTWKDYNASYISNTRSSSAIDDNTHIFDENSKDARIRSLFALAQEHLIRAYLRSQEEDGIMQAKTLLRGANFTGIVPTRVSLELLWRAHAYPSTKKIPTHNTISREYHAGYASTLLFFWKRQYQLSKDVRVHDEGLKPPPDYFITTLELLRNEKVQSKLYPLYKAMLEMAELEKDDAFLPTPDVFEWLLEYLSTRRDRKSYGHLLDVLHNAMILYRKTENEGYFPDQEFLNAALFRAGRHGRISDAMWLFRTLEQCWGVSGPTIHSVRFLFTALARAQEDGAALFAEAYLKHLETQNDNPKLRPNTDIYNLVFQSWSNPKVHRRQHNKAQFVAGERAEALLSRMERMYDRGNQQCKPNRESYHHVLMAYLNQIPMTLRAVSNADRIYRKMLIRHEQDAIDGVWSTSQIKTLDKVIMAYSRLYRNANAALHADKLFREIIGRFSNGTSLVLEEPDEFAYGHVLKCWNRARAPASAKNSLEIFQMMEELYASGKTEVIADSYCLRQLIDTLAYSDKEGHGELAKTLLERTLSLQGDTPDPKILGHAFWCAIRCYSNQKDPIGANIIFDQMLSLSNRDPKSVHLTGAPFKTLINSYAMHGSKGAGEKAEIVLAKLEEHYYSGLYPEARPSVDMYNDVILVWTKDPCKGSGRRAQAIFSQMQEMHEEGIPNMEPNGFSYMALAVAHALCPEEGSEDRAEKIVLQMTEWYLAGNDDMKVNIFTWNNVIEAWSKHSDAELALQKTLSLLEMLTNKRDARGRSLVVSLTAWTYESLLRALSRSSTTESLTKMESTVNELITRFTNYRKSEDRDKNDRDGGNHNNNNSSNNRAIIHPSINHINFLLQAYAKRAVDDASIAKRARRLYQTAQRQLRAGNRTMKPNTLTYSIMIDILTRSSHHALRSDEQDNISFADSILKQVEGLITSGIPKVEILSTECYGKVIEGYEKQNDFVKANDVKERMRYMHSNRL